MPQDFPFPALSGFNSDCNRSFECPRIPHIADSDFRPRLVSSYLCVKVFVLQRNSIHVVDYISSFQTSLCCRSARGYSP